MKIDKILINLTNSELMELIQISGEILETRNLYKGSFDENSYIKVYSQKLSDTSLSDKAVNRANINSVYTIYDLARTNPKIWKSWNSVGIKTINEYNYLLRESLLKLEGIV